LAFQGNFACDVFKTGLMDGTFDFSSDTTQTYKIALYTNQATLNASTTAYTTDGETSGAGYTAGGNVLTINVNPANVNNVTFLSFSNATWPSSTFTARGALIYKADGVTNPTVCVLDFGSDKTVTNQTFTVTFPAPTNTSAIIRIA
jgi:hypothetical protein